MFCVNCGSNIEDPRAVFCPECGASTDDSSGGGYAPSPAPPPAPSYASPHAPPPPHPHAPPPPTPMYQHPYPPPHGQKATGKLPVSKKMMAIIGGGVAAVILIIVLIVVLSGGRNNIVGTWEMSGSDRWSERLQINRDGTGIWFELDTVTNWVEFEEEFRWSISGDIIRFEIFDPRWPHDPDIERYEFSFTRNAVGEEILHLVDLGGWGGRMSFRRIR